MVTADVLHHSTDPQQDLWSLVSFLLFPSRVRRDEIARLDSREDLIHFDFGYDVVTCILELFCACVRVLFRYVFVCVLRTVVICGRRRPGALPTLEVSSRLRIEYMW